MTEEQPPRDPEHDALCAAGWEYSATLPGYFHGLHDAAFFIRANGKREYWRCVKGVWDQTGDYGPDYWVSEGL